MEMALRAYFSVQHLMSANHFVRKTERTERRIALSFDSEATTHLVMTYATGTIFAAGAFLEALINELFADAALADGGHLRTLPEQARKDISTSFQAIQMKSMFAKGEHLLRLAGAAPIIRTDPIAQSVLDLVEVRNCLVHYKGPWLDIATEGMKRPGSLSDSPLALTLRSSFEPRQGAGQMQLAGWLGAGCARWSVKAAVEFADEVCKRLGIQAPYWFVRP